MIRSLLESIESEGLDYALLEYSSDLAESDPCFQVILEEFLTVRKSMVKYLDILDKAYS